MWRIARKYLRAQGVEIYDGVKDAKTPLLSGIASRVLSYQGKQLLAEGEDISMAWAPMKRAGAAYDPLESIRPWDVNRNVGASDGLALQGREMDEDMVDLFNNVLHRDLGTMNLRKGRKR
ncbi:hypothetical protein PHYPSEUDO_002075 [Phytophthora pseudosyringae]|uniref:Uncharacterized protein n=1 Tax=Phytophthora pseudosyringae TaxID=221518 RepID=A0A8T1VY62_9STRA|nr:hypothetical protein PHYPSEUDO_002075 [Phytophthora pseudosyringae]